MYFYRTYGLVVASEIVLPELVVSEKVVMPDVTITVQPVEEILENVTHSDPYFQVTEDTCQFLVQGIARYQIEQGCRIVVAPQASPISEREIGDVRLYLLGTAMGVLLHQRRWLPLHVSALSTPSGVWAFTGPSGAGKSTLAAWLYYSQGWPLVSDDVAVLNPEDKLPYLYPGPPRLKLWQDALATLGIEQRDLIQDLTRTDKYHLCLDQKFQPQPQPLKALVILERANTGEFAELKPMNGIEAFQAVMASIYRPTLGMWCNHPQQLMSEGVRLTNYIKVYRYQRPWSLVDMNDCSSSLVRQIEEANDYTPENLSRQAKRKVRF